METLADLKAQRLEASRALEESGTALHATAEALSPVGVTGPLEWAFPTEILESLNQSDSAYRSQSLTH